jgi:cytochrome c5
MWPIRLRLLASLFLLGALLFPEPSRLQPTTPREHFVRGHVAAVVPVDQQKLRDIFLPHASVFLVRQNAMSTPVASAVTDLSGRFMIKTREIGVFLLCVEAQGFPRTCPDKVFRDPLPVTDAGTLRLPLFNGVATVPSPVAAAWGAVSLHDGKLARGFAPAMGVNFFPTVTLESKTLKYRGEVNEFGEYIVPAIPVREDFVLRVDVEKQFQERKIQAQTGLVPGHAYQLDFVLPNSAPRLRAVTAMAGGKPVQVAAPGSTIDLHAVTDDLDGDKLEYRWLLPDGHVVGPTIDPVLHFPVPAQRGNYLVSVAAGDLRGGFAQSGIAIRAEAAAAWFSGTVTDTFQQAINGALVEVNGRVTNTNAQGTFRFNVPLDDRYVMTIRSPGLDAPSQRAFGTASYVYKAPIMGGRWELRRAEVQTVDPTQPISLQHRRDERDCIGPRISRVDWTRYLSPNMVQWQDGRGNVVALGDLGAKDPKAVQGLMPLVERINPGLVKLVAGATGVRPKPFDEKLPCLPGIKVEIPPNSLIDTSTSKAPTGAVQLSVSTVALTAADQMPGDYSATDSGNKLTAMESFGAGSIEIGAAGTRYNLKPGATATVTIPVDATQRAGGAILEPTIPFLYYDEQAGRWKQDGVATLTGGANPAYVKQVTHFSSMNADILKSGQSCVAVELDPAAAFSLPLQVEVVMQPSKPNPGVIQVRPLTVDSLKSNVIYNLPNNSDIVLTPIVSGVLPDGSTGDVPAGVFVVNTGGPMNAAVVPPPPNPDGTYFAETGGNPTGPCASRVTLTRLNPVTLSNGLEFLQGLYFEASNITELNGTIGTAIDDGVVAYYQQEDPRQLRNSLNLFKSKNRFGQAAGANELEVFAHYANSGDLGFGRDMHCRKNAASDGQSDYACYVTNFGQPPANNADQQDANDVIDPAKHPDATVAMEFSRVENPTGQQPEFPDNDRAVKFYVYNTSQPDSAPLHNADLDGHGARPVPQLCMACHGGTAASAPADPANPTGPKKGAFASRIDIMSMAANFLPFDLHYYNFPTAEPKATQQAQFKSLNVDIVHGVSAATGTGGAIVEVIDTALYANNSAIQLEDQVIAGWDPANANSDQHRFYRDVFARACRTCHITQPFGAPAFNTSAAFEGVISNVQNRVCTQHIMPHAQRTNDVFWTSLNPNMPALLELYGQTLPGWSPLPGNQCSQGPVQGGGNTSSVFSSQIYPVMFTNCSGCHSSVGNANFAVVNPATTFNQLRNTLAKDGTSHYVLPNDPANSLMYHRISNGGVSEPNARMPLGGPNLVTSDTDTPPDGIPDATEVNAWINTGANGP